jgi:hypothetical protein
MVQKSMRTFYALSALVVGIVLLCLFVKHYEPFVPGPAPKLQGINISSIFLRLDSNNKLTFVSSTNKNISTTISTNEIKVNVPKNTTLNDYGIYSYGTGGQCTTTTYAFSLDSTQNCWYLASNGVTLSTSIKNVDSNIASSYTKQIQPNKVPVSIANGVISIKGVNIANTGITSKTPQLTNITIPNVRIDLSLS